MFACFSKTNVGSAGCLLMLASCAVINPTFGGEDSSTGAETSNSGVTLPSSSGQGTGSSVSDSISSTTLSSSTAGFETSSTGGSDSSGSADTVAFIEPTGGCDALPDGVFGHCSVDCNLMTQDCPEGEACRAWANYGGSVWNGTRCSPVSADPDQHGDPCVVEDSAASGIDTCDVGLMCWNVDSETLEGTCISYCSGTPEVPTCESPEQTCSITNDGVLVLCLPVCDPLQGNCDGDTVCVPTPADEFVCIPQEVASCPAGMLDVPAENIADCVAGEPCCTTYCDLTEDVPCDPELECVAFFTEPEPAYADLGVCITAM